MNDRYSRIPFNICYGILYEFIIFINIYNNSEKLLYMPVLAASIKIQFASNKRVFQIFIN